MRPPINGEAPITQNYGDNPGGNNPPGGHNGRDYGVPVGTPIVAVTDGTIIFEGWTSGEYSTNQWWFLPGDMVIVLQAGDGTQFVYGHLNTTSVSGGDRVREGQVIGTTGNTGKSTGPHLHFEALAPGYDLNNGMYGRTDPAPYIDGTLTTQSIGETMALTPEQSDQLAYIASPKFKTDLYTGASTQEVDARAAFIGQILNHAVQVGDTDQTTNLGLFLRWYAAGLDNVYRAATNTTDTATIATHLITALGQNLAADVVAEIGRQLATPSKEK